MTEIANHIIIRIERTLARIAALDGSPRSREIRRIYLDPADFKAFKHWARTHDDASSYRGVEVSPARDWMNGSRIFNRCNQAFTIAKVKA